ncbi:NucA/NucB deoxyribonuclease domain-containing protein [Kitasatospora sp. Ki12]
MRHRTGDHLLKLARQLFAAVASLALTAALCALGAQPAAAQPPANRTVPQGHSDCTEPGADLSREGMAWTCIKTGPATVPPAAPGKTCTPVGPGTKAYEEGAVKSCTEVTHGPAREALKSSIPVWSCKSDTWYASTRHSYCLESEVDYTLEDKEGAPIGSAILHIAQQASLDSRGASWREQVDATTVQATPNVGSMVFVFEASCSGQCTLDNRRMSATIAPGETKRGFFTFRTTVGNETQSEIVPSYHSVTYSTGENIPRKRDNRWNNPNTVRCDAKVSKDANTGCIVMGNMADVRISIAKYGAAAITYQWAQNTLIGGNFGTKDHTLIRVRDDDGKIRDRNRYQSCEAAPNPFKPILVTAEQDSCDEFPFAATAQGGTNGNLCTEIQPWWNSDHWEVKMIRYPGPMVNCVRSHVPLKQNSGAGGEYGNAVLSERILDGENFTVTITD